MEGLGITVTLLLVVLCNIIFFLSSTDSQLNQMVIRMLLVLRNEEDTPFRVQLFAMGIINRSLQTVKCCTTSSLKLVYLWN